MRPVGSVTDCLGQHFHTMQGAYTSCPTGGLTLIPSLIRQPASRRLLATRQAAPAGADTPHRGLAQEVLAPMPEAIVVLASTLDDQSEVP